MVVVVANLREGGRGSTQDERVVTLCVTCSGKESEVRWQLTGSCGVRKVTEEVAGKVIVVPDQSEIPVVSDSR